ncbi:hypothetical protein ES703_69586 [subsurface metagenome]
MESDAQYYRRISARQAERSLGVSPLGESISDVLDRGARKRRTAEPLPDDADDEARGEYRARTPTNSERLNRALTELSSAAFKIHTLVWKWRGAPARGLLPYFTIHSLGKFCSMTRPTVRLALRELARKGWIQRLPYNKHQKNTLYRLVSIRKVPPPPKER